MYICESIRAGLATAGCVVGEGTLSEDGMYTVCITLPHPVGYHVFSLGTTVDSNEATSCLPEPEVFRRTAWERLLGETTY